MDELTLQVKNMKDDLTAQVVRTEEGQCQLGAALRDIEASLLKKKHKELQESIHQEIASEDRTPQGGLHDQDVPDVDGQLPHGLCSSATQKAITFDGMVEGRHGQAQLGRRGPPGKLHQGLLAPVEQSPAGGWCVTTTVGDTRR